LNIKSLPYLVVCTHCHFDHIGGNHLFASSRGILMGGRDKTFTQNFEINSLAMAHSGAKVKGFEISRWLEEGELIYLDDSDPIREKSLEVIFTPGHTSDSIALYSHFENRLFVGDSIYPFTAIHLDCLGSNVKDYVQSLKKLCSFIQSLPPRSKSFQVISSRTGATLSQNARQFLEIVGINENEAASSFDIELLLTIGGSVEGAVEAFFNSDRNELAIMCPPKRSPDQEQVFDTSELKISCGHVEANLSSNSLEEMLNFLEMIKVGAIAPVSIDGEYGEYTNNTFSIMLPLKAKWE